MAALPLLRFRSLSAAVPDLVHALTTRRGGVSVGAWASLNLGFSSGDDAAHVRENRRRVAAALGGTFLVTGRQVHGADMAYVGDASDDPGDVDVLILRRPGVLAAVLSADCPLALVVDPVGRTLALVHSGWRGTVAGVLPRAVETLVRECGARREDLRIGLGPAIGPDHYEVGGEVVSRVLGACPGAEMCIRGRRGDRGDLDLRGVLLLQLRDVGLDASHVEHLGGCTYEDDARFYSHRREGPHTGRHALVAGWRP